MIARQLGIAEPTVKIHVQHVLRKLNNGFPRAGRRYRDQPSADLICRNVRLGDCRRSSSDYARASQE